MSDRSEQGFVAVAGPIVVIAILLIIVAVSAVRDSKLDYIKTIEQRTGCKVILLPEDAKCSQINVERYSRYPDNRWLCCP